MNNCLVIGGGGFLGLALVRMLKEKGMCVKVLGRHKYPDAEALGAESLVCDIRNYDQVTSCLKGCDTVFHTASKAGIWGPYEEYYSINVEGCRNIINACRSNNVESLIYTSTPSVIYHPNTKIINVNEDIPYPKEFQCAYASTKAQAEKMLLDANGQGIRTVALRPHLIYGPGDPHLIPRVVSRAKLGKIPQVGDGTNKVDLTYVDNAALAHILAALHLDNCAGKAYFISDGEPVLLWPWINELLKRLDIPPIKRKLSYGFTSTLGGIMESVYSFFHITKEPLMTRFTASQFATSHYFNIDNARRDLDYKPIVSGSQGVDNLVEWIKNGGLDGKA